MSDASDIAKLMEKYWTIAKIPHDPAATDFIGHCQSYTTRANGKPYKYFQRGSGPTVLLVHGVHSNLGSMVPIAQSLLKQDYRVVLFDAPAHGEALGTTTNPVEVRELITAICGQLGDLHAIVAHSLGSLWALSSYGRNVNPKAFISISSPSNHRFLVEKFIQMNQIDPDIAQKMYPEIETLLGEDAWAEYSPLEIVKTIDIPGLIIHGAKDNFVPPEHAADLHSGWHGSALELVDDAGHLNILASHRVLPLIPEFLREAK